MMVTFKNRLENYKAKIIRSLRGRGIWGSIMFLPMRLWHNRKFRNFDFRGTIDPFDLDGPDEVKIHASKYEATSHLFFKKLFASLNWPYQESTFVDFGCGKGAALLYACKLGFRKVIGVEFSPSLAETAIINMQKLSDKQSNAIDFKIVNTDASLYEIPPDADCFYFFNPFDASILDKVMQNIYMSLAIRNRRIIIIYLNALHREVIEKYPVQKIKFLPTKELDIYYHGGAYVYQNF
jgi:SAM-dependent methyltransferase